MKNVMGKYNEMVDELINVTSEFIKEAYKHNKDEKVFLHVEYGVTLDSLESAVIKCSGMEMISKEYPEDLYGCEYKFTFSYDNHLIYGKGNLEVGSFMLALKEEDLNEI